MLKTLHRNLEIEHMTPAHKSQVLEIEGCCHEYPWTWDDFMGFAGEEGVWIYVAQMGQRVLGYIVVQRHHDEQVTEIVSMGVLPDVRRLKVGARLVRYAIDLIEIFTGSPHSDNKLRAVVRERNLDAQLFFKELGFKCTNILKGHYDESDEDAYVFKLDARN